MGKLEEIVARNRRASRPRESALLGIIVGVFILVIIALAAFTDLGSPPPDDDAGSAGLAAPPGPRDRVVHVPLGSPRAPRGSNHGAQ